ncbi:MAG: hypothetical protein HEEMFOPI_00368 [Holosporales bacterium]
MNFSKKILCLSLCAVSSIGYGVDIVGSSKPFTGIFLLGRFGGGQLSGDYQYSASGGGKLSPSGYGTSFGGGVGYMMLTQAKAWFAGEIYYDVKSANPSANDTSYGKISVRAKNVMGGSLLIGGAASPRFVMYARAGYEAHNFTFKYDPQSGSSRSVDCKFNTPIAGAGALFKLSDRIILGGDVTHSLATKDMTPDTAYPQDTFKPAETRIFGSIRVVF